MIILTATGAGAGHIADGRAGIPGTEGTAALGVGLAIGRGGDVCLMYICGEGVL